MTNLTTFAPPPFPWTQGIWLFTSFGLGIKSYARRLLSYPELGPHLATPDHTPSNHNPDHVQRPKWTPVMVDRPTHWVPPARVHHPHDTCYLILELTWIRADYCMTHSCNNAQLKVRPIKINSSLANTSLLMLLPRHRLPPAITARHLVCHIEYGTLIYIYRATEYQPS